MKTYIGLLGFVVVFGLVWGLLRYEFEMPRLVALAFGGLLVLLGVVAAAVGQLVGMDSLTGLSSIAVGVVAMSSVLLSLVS